MQGGQCCALLFPIFTLLWLQRGKGTYPDAGCVLPFPGLMPGNRPRLAVTMDRISHIDMIFNDDVMNS